MYDDRMMLQINSFINGFTELFWYKDNANQVYKVTLPKNKVIVAGLSNNTYYTFYTRNPKTGVETETMTFYFQSNLPSYDINRLWSAANIEATTYTTNLKNQLTVDLQAATSTVSSIATSTVRTIARSASLLELIYNRYCNISELEDFEEDLFYKLIICQEAYENLRYSNYNREGVGFARLTILPSPVISISSDVETVKVYKIVGGNKVFHSVYRPEDNTLTILLEQGLYEIHLLQDSCLFSILRHCNLSERCMIKLWDDYQNNNMDYLDIIENNLSSSMNFEAFSSEEVTMYKEEVGMNPMNAVIPRISVTEEKYLRSVELLISGVAFANTSQHTFFVSGRDTDFLTENIQNEFIPLIAETNTFTAKFEPATCMIDKEALLYVIDERGIIVSKVNRCIFDEDSTTSLADYYEKIRQSEINSYGRRLLAQVLTSYPEGWSYTQEMITRCIEDDSVNIDNILSTLLADVHNAPHDIDKDLLSVEVLKDFISSSNYDLSFFDDDGIVWKPVTHTIVGEPSDVGYVLCILAKFEGNTTYSTHYVHSFTDQTTEVLLNRYGSYAIYAISELDYSYSGFVYLNTVNGFVKSYLVNLEVR